MSPVPSFVEAARQRDGRFGTQLHAFPPRRLEESVTEQDLIETIATNRASINLAEERIAVAEVQMSVMAVLKEDPTVKTIRFNLWRDGDKTRIASLEFIDHDGVASYGAEKGLPEYLTLSESSKRRILQGEESKLSPIADEKFEIDTATNEVTRDIEEPYLA